MPDRIVCALVFGAYRLGLWLATPLLAVYLRWRAARGRESPERLAERWGRAGQPRPAGALAWLHAASVGELFSVLPLIEALRTAHPALGLLVTTGTLSSARLAEERLPAGVPHQFAPLDHPLAVRRFLRHWRPQIGLIVESELWPTLLAETRRQGGSLVLLNGRMSARSYRFWRRLRPCARRLFADFALVLAQSETAVARLGDLGAPAPCHLGNLKSAATGLAVDGTELERLRHACGDRPLWVAASTHPGEDEIVLAAHRALRRRHPSLLTVVAPRHPERGGEVAALAAAAGESAARRSRGEPPGRRTAVYVADTLGELGLWYRLVGIAFVGGSLVPHGGQNLLEPARLGCAVLVGPHTENFAELAARLHGAGALLRIHDATSLAAAVGRLLEDPGARRALGAAAARCAAAETAVLEQVQAALAPLIAAALAARPGEARRDPL